MLAWLLVPAAVGWFGYVVLDSMRNYAPQEIRLSADGEYDPYFDDFAVFYAAGRIVDEGRGDDLYKPEALHQEQADELGVPVGSIIRLPYYNPPHFALALAPLPLLPIGLAAAVWTLIQVAAFLGSFASFWRLKSLGKERLLGVIVLLSLVSSMPFHEIILHGQISLILVVAWIALWFGSVEGRDDRLTVLAVTLLAVKPQLAVVPVAYLMLSRRWRALTIAFAIQLSFGLIASLVLSPWIELNWLRLMLQAARWDDQNGIWIHAMFGWNAFIRAMVGSGHEFVRAILATCLSLTTAGLGAFWARSRYRGERQPELFGMLIFTAILISPHLFAQDLILAGLPFGLLIARRSGAERTGWIVLGLIGWTLSFVHFGWVMAKPDELGINYVTLWVFVSFVACGMLLQKPLEARPDLPDASASGLPRRSLAIQLGLAMLLASTLFILIPGLAGHRMASAIEYSYSAKKGPTYRIVLLDLAND